MNTQLKPETLADLRAEYERLSDLAIASRKTANEAQDKANALAALLQKLDAETRRKRAEDSAEALDNLANLG